MNTEGLDYLFLSCVCGVVQNNGVVHLAEIGFKYHDAVQRGLKVTAY